MLSSKVKARISKNKQSRIDRRRKTYRDLQTLIRSVTRRTANHFVEQLIKGRRPQLENAVLDDVHIGQLLDGPPLLPTGFDRINRMLKGGGGFKRGELFIIGADTSSRLFKSDILGPYRRALAAARNANPADVIVPGDTMELMVKLEDNPFLGPKQDAEMQRILEGPWTTIDSFSEFDDAKQKNEGTDPT